MSGGERRVPSVRIARATLADGAAIRACMQAAFMPFQGQYTSAAYEDTVPTLEAVSERIETMTVLVARNDGGGIVGTIGAAVRGVEGHIRGMAVTPSVQGGGVADQLLHAIEQALVAAGCAFVTLDTTAPLLRAIRFYERNGYVRTGSVSDFFGMQLLEYKKLLLSNRQ